jgi:hypothetical protein
MTCRAFDSRYGLIVWTPSPLLIGWWCLNRSLATSSSFGTRFASRSWVSTMMGPALLRLHFCLLLSSASTRVLINGAAGKAFRHGRGLWQGTSCRCYSSCSSWMLSRQCFVQRKLQVCCPLPAGLRHRVSLYTDNIVVFARPNPTELEAVRGILDCFGEMSGLWVNLQKSSAAPIQCS